MDKINKSKTALKSKITKIENFIENESSNCELAVLKVKQRKIDALIQNADDLRNNCYGIIDVKATDFENFEVEVEQCEDRLEKLQVRIETLIDSCKKNVRNSDNENNDSFEIKTKIPPLNLPVFSGKYEEFSSFKSQFDDLITKNTQFTNTQKLYYLRSCLTSEAKDLASNFDSFDSLYESLESRFDNKRLIIDIHVQAILKFEKIQNENAKDIRNMIDCVQKNLRALKVLKFDRNELFDIFLINILSEKLDRETRKNFEISHKTKDVPSLEEFIEFLEQRESVLLSVNRNVPSENKKANKFPFPNKSKILLMDENKNKICIKCKQMHPLYRCKMFLNSTVDERLKLVRLHKLCELCLRKNHKKYNCFSSYRCKCGGTHTKLLCYTAANSNPKASPDSRFPETTINVNKNSDDEKNTSSQSAVLSNRASEVKKKQILFATAEIYVHAHDSRRVKLRCILDSASNVCVLTSQMCSRLGIKRERIQKPVCGLNEISQNIKWKINTFISSEDSSFTELVEFLIVDKITGLTPSVSLNISDIQIPKFLKLADKSFFEAKEVHALLSADIFFKVLKQNTYKVNDELFFKESDLGWIACGKLNEMQHTEHGHCFLSTDNSIQDTLKLFFDLEGLGIRDDPVQSEKDQAMEKFDKTVEYKNGRYVVEFPFRKSYEELADNYLIAKQRFETLWRRLSHDPELHRQYCEIFNDYLEQGIIEEVNTERALDKPLYYMPHQPVRKTDRLTSKTRIVFDAGSHQNEQLSLNDCLWPGPNLNPNLLDILIDFRLNRIAICSDIKQAFLQIGLSEEHKDAVRFLWSDEKPCLYRKPKLQVYRFNRVNFGVCSSPFLLAATIRHHLEKFKTKYPDTVQLLDSHFYVDDLIIGGNEFEESLEISRNAKNIMEAAGMSLRKWISNDVSLMEQWKADGFDTYPVDKTVSLGSNLTKVLGMTWDTQEDFLTMDTRSLQEFVSVDKNTKRFMLQALGKIFDPLGLITPFTVRMKCLIQDLWNDKIPWDENLPPDIEREWKKWCAELPFLDSLKIHRLVFDSTCKEDVVEIHSFSDASKKAYGGAVYLKLKTRDKISVALVTSKSRVAPLKGLTLPRLELLGALVTARLASKVKKIVNMKRSSVEYYWTDSTITLFWIKGIKTRWKQFVANRVKEITTLTDPETWFHCSGKDNPADFLTRGLSAESLLQADTWWRGPLFLQSDEIVENEHKCPVPNEDDYLPELKRDSKQNDIALTLKVHDSFFDGLIIITNRFMTLIRILSFVFRFKNNCRNPGKKRKGCLTNLELAEAEEFLVKQLQRREFPKEINSLESKGYISPKSKISNLSPFLDAKGVMRVGGRLQNSQLPYISKHPMLIPSIGKLSEMIVTYYHLKYLHLGPQQLLFEVRKKYWPIHGRSLCKKIVHNCVVCFKANPKGSFQKMGNLPKERVTPDKVFNSAGIDLCGPILIRNKFQRKGPEIKVYICIFICLVTKAIHLEIISDLTSQALIATLKRFISRRGKCQKIFSDNGTNMVGADRELKSLFELVKRQEESLFAFFAEENIKWCFIPPRSPSWGGLWEGNIKVFKYHFKRVAGNSKFTYEELLTLIAQIEAILNSRPLTPLSTDVDDLEVLTPGHFLIGRPITAVAEPSLTDIDTNRLNVWQRITKSVQTIWKRWSISYLNSLQERKKWTVAGKNLKIGDMVLIKEENLPPCKWLLGRIVALYPGQDNKIRLVDVKTTKGTFKRSITRLCVLPIET